MANAGASKLAQVIVERIRQQTQRPDALELGSIQADMSLLIDRFPIPLRKGDYLAADGLTLQPGNRVLVAWVNDGTDPVILCRVVST